MTVHQEIQRSNSTIGAMQRTLADMEQKRDATWSIYKRMEARCRSLRLAISSVWEDMSDAMERSLGAPPAPPADWAGGAVPRVNLDGCRNMGDRLHRIAVATGGRLDVDVATYVIQQWWPAGATRDTVRSDINRWVRENPHDWELISQGVYRCLRDQDVDDSETEGH
ncbi:MAG: hypothetical protein OXF79_20930 [Chloroflexi bacterium]|nr:hypothetical protein [Chloroflexota bacterium]